MWYVCMCVCVCVCVCVEIRFCVICKHRGRDLEACLCVDRLSCIWICVGRDQNVFVRIDVYACETRRYEGSSRVVWGVCR